MIQKQFYIFIIIYFFTVNFIFYTATSYKIDILFTLLGFITILIFYKLSQNHFSNQSDVYLATTIFMFLPANIVVTETILVLPLILLFILLFEKNRCWILPFIMLLIFILHDASIIFFVSLFIYSLINKKFKLGIFSMLFLVAFIFLSKGIEIGGKPSGHFIEIFGSYATLFSPLLFIYFFYSMYRILFREEKSLIWYISFTALIFSLILSIRQKVDINDFAPYVMIAIILMLKLFNNTIRVRLPEFKKKYKYGFILIIFSLIINILFIIINSSLYFMA